MSGLRIASWPHWYGPNPYLPSLYRALEAEGFVHVPDIPIDPAAFRSGSRRADVLHLHWVYPLWRTERRLGAGRRIRSALGVLAEIRASGTPIVWTVHNLEPHDGYRSGERSAYTEIRRIADVCLYHTEHARRAAHERFGPTDADERITPHGLLRGSAPSLSNEEVRDRYGIERRQVMLLCFGQVRQNKGFDLAHAALDQLGDDYQLVVAGRATERGTKRWLRGAGRDPRVTVVGGLVDDGLLASLVAAADAVLLPYRSITGSGAFLQAIASARGVISSDLPFFEEVARPVPDAVGRFAPESAAALAEAVRRYLETPPDVRRARLDALAERYAWHRCVEPLAAWLDTEGRSLVRASSAEGSGS